MPPSCSERWNYFTKGLHPNPPISDGRTGGAPHTPMHPCSNPKVFWVQCNFCIERNGGQLLDDDKAWLKSREEQMMQHLKTCCQESRRAWEEIMDWKYHKKVANGKIPNKKRAAPIEALRGGPQRDAKFEGGGAAKKSARMSNHNAASLHKMESAGAATSSAGLVGYAPVSSSSSSPRGSTADHQNKLNPTQLRYFHKICTIAVASRKLDFTFFEDPIIMELCNVLRSGVVAGGQLPSQRLLVGEKADGTENYIEKYASEQVTNDIVKVIRALKRYEGLKTSVLCDLTREASETCRAPPATFLCGGEISCLVAPAMQKKAPATTFGGVSMGQDVHTDSYKDAAVALAAKVEAQLWFMGDTLGQTMLSDEEGLLPKPDGTNARKGSVKTDDTRQDTEDEVKSRQSMGLACIGSCLLTKCSRGPSEVYSAGTVSRAHGILANRWPMIFFTSNGCFSEQLNLLLKDCLTGIPATDFLEPAEHAFAATRLLQKLQSSASANPSAKKWIENFEKVILDVYYGGDTEMNNQVKESLKLGSDIYFTSWTHTQRRLALLLRIRSGCYTFATQYSMESGFPDECRSFTNNGFWDSLEKAEALVRPLCRAALKYVPEKDMTMRSGSSKDEEDATISTTMADVVYAFYSLYHAWRASDFPEGILLLEKRWRRYECPWMLLAFIFHPAYTEEAKAFLQKQTKEDGLFSVKYLSNAILGYTVKYLASELTGDHPLSIPVLKRQATAYMDRLERGEVDNAASMQMKKDWKEYWSFQSSTPELAKFVLFLLSTSVQSNTVDGMFQDLTGQYVQLAGSTDGFHVENPERSKFKEQLEILEKAGKPIEYKWRTAGASKHGSTKVNHIVNPAEKAQAGAKSDPSGSRLPPLTTLPTITTPRTETKKELNKTSVTKQETLYYDPLEHARTAYEASIVSKLSTSTFGSEHNGSNQITHFWSNALSKLGDDEDDEFEDAAMVEHQHDGGCQESATTMTTSSSHPAEDGSGGVDNDDDLPQFTMPAYAKTATPATQVRKVRRTYRPEQINFDFMKNWTDTRDQPLSPDDSSSPDTENVSQLKNYRANKIKLADFFESDSVPKSFEEFVAKFDDDDFSSSNEIAK